ncbi:hypothetical protein FGO68_gene8062 [Halteria grandinella]|uniref:Uncharacterized protein n=1 Tax=Halteria grandinella TaxID=5974 RepID=A0A8J8T4J9_HALGN|nr:hypothetical protein FGO68_gene8062 [Halteria grandinella]
MMVSLRPIAYFQNIQLILMIYQGKGPSIQRKNIKQLEEQMRQNDVKAKNKKKMKRSKQKMQKKSIEKCRHSCFILHFIKTQSKIQENVQLMKSKIVPPSTIHFQEILILRNLILMFMILRSSQILASFYPTMKQCNTVISKYPQNQCALFKIISSLNSCNPLHRLKILSIESKIMIFSRDPHLLISNFIKTTNSHRLSKIRISMTHQMNNQILKIN